MKYLSLTRGAGTPHEGPPKYNEQSVAFLDKLGAMGKQAAVQSGSSGKLLPHHSILPLQRPTELSSLYATF